MKRYALALFAALTAATVFACGSNDPNTLGGGDPGAGQGGGNNGGGGGTNPGGPVDPGQTNPGGVVIPPGTTGANTPPPGVTDNKAKAFFIKTVFPELSVTCASCHNSPGSGGAPGYWSTDGSIAYTSVEARGYIAPASMLLKKGQHTGPALTGQQTTDVAQWLDLETQVRGNNIPINILSKLGTCVDATKFAAIQLDQLRTIPRKGENPNNCTGCNNAPCQTCHQQGEYAMHSNFSKLGQTTLQALQGNATSPEGLFIVSKYVGTNGTSLVPSTALKDKAAAVSTGTPYSHPMFTLNATTQTAITDFATDIVTKYTAKTCGQ
jgi:hypothetical protein